MQMLLKLRRCLDARLAKLETAELYVIAISDRPALIAEIDQLATHEAGSTFEDRIYGKQVIFREWVNPDEPLALTWPEFTQRERDWRDKSIKAEEHE
jgi:hypothetical protein